MRVAVPFPRSLSDVAEFMSLAAPGLTSDQWAKWCRKRPDWLRWEKGNPLRMTIEEAKGLREELHQDLTRIHWHREMTRMDKLKGNPFTALRLKLEEVHQALIRMGKKEGKVYSQNPFATILQKLNELQLEFRWTAEKEKKGSTRGFSFGEERWLIQSWPWTDDKRQAFYFILGEALRTGSIATLRACEWLACGKFYVVKDPRQHFCVKECRYKFHNWRKKEEGKSREYREAGRQKAIKKATRRIKTSLSLKRVLSHQQVQEIKVETGLPRRVIDELVEKATL